LVIGATFIFKIIKYLASKFQALAREDFSRYAMTLQSDILIDTKKSNATSETKQSTAASDPTAHVPLGMETS
jgi:hypothetical protein